MVIEVVINKRKKNDNNNNSNSNNDENENNTIYEMVKINKK